jgi:hypothetical protein
MSTWKNEDDIKAELRTLTEDLRKLREELRGMVTPKKTNPTRALLHRQQWPRSADEEIVGEAADEPRQPGKPRKR